MSINEDSRSSYIEIKDDTHTLIKDRRYALALLAMYREGNPSLGIILPTLDYRVSEDVSTQLSEKEIEQLIKYLNQLKVSTFIESMGLVLIGGFGILLGFVGITFFLQRTPGIVTLNVAIAPVLCLCIPFGLPICLMGIKGLRTLRDPGYGVRSFRAE